MVADTILVRLLLTAGLILAALLFRLILRRSVSHALRKVQEAKKRLVHRLLTASAWLLLLIGLIIIWGGSFENVWVSVTGLLGIVAIGFFAVWSILSNIIAGAALMLTRHLDIGDEVEVLPEKAKGRIVDIGALFVVLEGRGGTVLIPNNQFVQKVVKKKS